MDTNTAHCQWMEECQVHLFTFCCAFSFCFPKTPNDTARSLLQIQTDEYSYGPLAVCSAQQGGGVKLKA